MAPKLLTKVGGVGGGKQLEAVHFWLRCAPVYARGRGCVQVLVEGGDEQHGDWWDSVAGGSSLAPWGLAEDGGGRRWDAHWGLEEGMCCRHSTGTPGTAPQCQPSPGVPVGTSLCPAPATATMQRQVWDRGLWMASGLGLFLAGGLGVPSDVGRVHALWRRAASLSPLSYSCAQLAPLLLPLPRCRRVPVGALQERWDLPGPPWVLCLLLSRGLPGEPVRDR